MDVSSFVFRGVVVVSLISLSASCGKSSSSSASFNAPAVAPIVNAALPAGLQAASTSSVHGEHARTFTPSNANDDGSNAVNYIKAMFNEYFINGIDGNTYQGYLNSLITAIDDRMSGINTQISTMGSTPKCLSSAVTSEVFNLSAIDSMLDFTAPYLQCYNEFSAGGANVAGAGSGADFGTDGNGNYSLWLQLNFSGTGTFDQTGGFIAVANVLNYGSTSTTAPETVDGLLLSYDPASGNNRITVARFTASKTTGAFALFVASNSPSTSGGSTAADGTSSNNDSYLGSGLRLISDGTHVYSDGLLLDTSSTQTYYNFNICLNASDLSEDTSGYASDCYSLANSYATTAWASLYSGLTTNPNALATTARLNYNEVTGCVATLPSTSLVAHTATSSACDAGVALPGTSSNANQTTPSSTILTALSGLSLPSTLTNLSSQ